MCIPNNVRTRWIIEEEEKNNNNKTFSTSKNIYDPPVFKLCHTELLGINKPGPDPTVPKIFRNKTRERFIKQSTVKFNIINCNRTVRNGNKNN